MSNLSISTGRACVGKVYLNDLTVQAYQERATLQIKLQRCRAEIEALEKQWKESNQTLRELECFHQLHAEG